jgi:hypothetical protein
MWVSRHGRNARFLADLAASADAVAHRVGPPPIRRPYSGGHQRQRPRREHLMAKRREVLAEVLTRFPKVTAGKLRSTWDSSSSTPGGLLRTRLRLQPQDPPPGESTLRADLREIRR